MAKRKPKKVDEAGKVFPDTPATPDEVPTLEIPGEPTKAQEVMIADGLPAAAVLTKEQRTETWKENPPKATAWIDHPVAPKEIPPDVAAFAAEEEARKKSATQTRIAKMKKGIAKKNGDEPNTSTHRWDARKNKWVPLTGKQAEEVKKAARGNKVVPVKPAKPSKVLTNKKSQAKEYEVVSEIAKVCGVKSNNRRLTLDFLNSTIGKQRKIEDIVKHVYGDKDDMTAALPNVIKGIEKDFSNSKTKYEIKREKTEKGITYGLYKKG